MADIKQKYGTSNQALTITLASLASAAMRECTAVDNTTDLFMDVKVAVKVKTGASGVSSTGSINIYAYASVDGGTSYTSSATGSDAVYSGRQSNLIYLGSLDAVNNAVTYSGTFSLSRVFGYGGIPAKWGIIIENLSGAALDATGGNHSVTYQGVLAQAV